MYKDKDKQREANRKAQAKFKAKGITEGITNQGITEGITEGLGLRQSPVVILDSSPKRGKDIKCFTDLPVDVQDRINRMKTGVKYKEREIRNEIRYQQFITVGKPGDAGYNGVCTPEWRAERGRGIQGSVSVQPSLSVKRSINH